MLSVFCTLVLSGKRCFSTNKLVYIYLTCYILGLAVAELVEASTGLLRSCCDIVFPRYPQSLGYIHNIRDGCSCPAVPVSVVSLEEPATRGRGSWWGERL